MGNKLWSNLPEYFMLKLLFQLDALEYIHENNYVHADVKASNCLLGYKAGKTDNDVVNILKLFSNSHVGLWVGE